MASFSHTISLPDPDDTTALGRQLASVLRPGDVVLLDGEIGAGKTHLARAVIQTLQSRFGSPEDVPSPTFTLVQTYLAGGTEIWHADLYRIGGPDGVIELGLDEAFETAICLVEWPDRLGDLAPKGALRISLAVVGDGRQAVFSGNETWMNRLATLFSESVGNA